MRAPPDEKVLGLELLTSFVAPEIGPGTMAASLTMSMASLAVSGTVRAPVARTGSAARAPVKAVGGSAFMPAKLASKMTMKSSLAGAFRVRLAFGGGEALHRARAPVVVVPYRITGSGGLADVGLSSEPLAPRFPAPSIPTFFTPASPRLAHKPHIPRYPLRAGLAMPSAVATRKPALGRGALVVTAGGRSIGCTLRGTRRARARTSGFRARLQTPSGRKVLKLRRKKGRKYLAPAGAVNGWNREKKKSLK